MDYGQECINHNRKILISIARLIDKLPEEGISAEIKEQELCTRYLASAFQPLLDDPENNVHFRWTGTTNDDAKALPKESIFTGRLDAMMSCLEGVQYKMTTSFAEHAFKPNQALWLFQPIVQNDG
ncbi:hypothetical protein G6F46_007931 [Rhizopus delemar]|uniref:Uncharacterized protein n=1 Tax=Rhizopus delemar (strain RA 99-880 / ATCC MYA-4621 / FGSC 9543 / NRRL 43880) TaxID=246409 RepID=I1BKR9_RHIO9|nr:hypothetical protein RO3G_01503 [Rhizopus delemar RA 99-880]KAG1492126.1 hypothetical protein G6F54_009533 [Rhizopus delemar]KAG1506344.1 hypothetical protein G6F53_009759 [Rhizopus delemar]KAG1580052.1 hypothetical protein G6F48_010717 [Rhizopus delemar]KAG1587939.1 hypothetical protein G6F47_010790 [Rhizopus delemar]|eukprot:EIE76799.1 hypothetical protein RO3G_01503 [Rhizopus delemar RA 99-880]